MRVLILEPSEEASSGDATTRSWDSQGDVLVRASSLDEAVEEARKVQPDVLVVDDRLAAQAGVEGLARVHKASPGSRVFVLTDVSGALALDVGRMADFVTGFLNRDRLGQDVDRAFLDATLFGIAVSARRPE